MNEETKNLINSKITELLSWLEEAGKTGSSFVAEQTPLYIQELLAWNFWHSFIFFMVGCLFLLLLIFGVYRIKKVDWDTYDLTKEQFFAAGAIVLGGIIGPIFTTSNLDWLQINIAPRVWLVEYLQGMIQ